MTNTPTRPETMVERVDRVIREKVLEVYDIMLLNSPEEIGRAAIEAIREPTDAMVERAVPAVTISIDRGPALNREAQQQAEDFAAPRRRDVANIYRAMINAALGDG